METKSDNNVLKRTNAEATHGNSKKGRRIEMTRLKVLEVHRVLIFRLIDLLRYTRVA